MVRIVFVDVTVTSRHGGRGGSEMTQCKPPSQNLSSQSSSIRLWSPVGLNLSLKIMFWDLRFPGHVPGLWENMAAKMAAELKACRAN